MLPEKTVAVVAGKEETDREDVLDVLRCRQSVIEGSFPGDSGPFPSTSSGKTS